MPLKSRVFFVYGGICSDSDKRSDLVLRADVSCSSGEKDYRRERCFSKYTFL